MALQCVVVGVDGSEASVRAAAFAIRVLEGSDGRLVVVSAYLDRPELPRSDSDEFRAEMAACADAAGQSAAAAGVAYSTVVLEGDPQDVLEQVAEREAADLIVVGTRGRSGLTRALLGSVATHFTTHGTIPAAVVH